MDVRSVDLNSNKQKIADMLCKRRSYKHAHYGHARPQNMANESGWTIGKTTTTERLLYFAGATKTMGDVDCGDTVTDYMAQERERGITITSAAITFYWKHHRINLIDTPGHVDFTVEVERCLRVLDGAVTVLDASAGVEAQTLAVWSQAQKFGIPSIIFLNKMDKIGASVPLCLQSIETRLKTTPLLLCLPVWAEKTRNLKESHNSNFKPLEKLEFQGILDLLKLEKLQWPSTLSSEDEIDGRTYKESRSSGLLFVTYRFFQINSGSL